ncbi:MAG: Zinc ABC transporter, substrate-binding protein ZnuA [uncultured Frankineae bacterium]|uniref:Zinc ABC transporter, substrate-binding protein ZnuA n=1 Tax=uncultured Frankineae bacterium TaxID=437475 RepID=A0A6J4M6T5_9ACTN|nr:MAG: Zinc ABC transporter, substrate-binding protein ZnuA [uncultured Frankineae bacterium]
MRTAAARTLLALTAAVAAAGCSSSSAVGGSPAAAGSGSVSAVVGFYPYEFVTARVGGDAVEVTNLTEPGAEPHDLELSPRQVAAVSEADLVVYSAGFQPAVDEAVEQQADDRALDVLSVVELRDTAEDSEEGHAQEGHADGDPHVWLDPVRLGAIATEVAERLAEVDGANAEDHRARAAELTAELTALDEELRAGLASCERRSIVTSHDAFGYLAQAYDLEQVAIAGLSPDDEASPQRLAEVADRAEAAGVTTIFFEELVSPKVAESLAREVGATAEVLSPLEGPPDSGDYVTAMRSNLQKLRAALGCT